MKYKKEMLGTSKGNISLNKKGSRKRTAKRMLFISFLLICLFILSITNIQAVDPPISISYPFESLSIWYGNAVIGKMPTVEGGTPTLFEVNPPLPEGLAFDPETGTIGGKNSDLQGISGKQEYTVTASNEAGSVSCVIFIEIKPPARLTGDPLAIVRGEKATLEWRVSNIGSPEVTISNIGSVERTGTIEVSPEETTTYSIDIEAGGYFFENVRSVTIQVGSSSELPEPVITVHPSTTVEVGEPVIFDGRSSTDNEPLGKEDGLVNTYVWDYGDGSEVTEKNWGFRSGAVCMHYFMKPGTFPVTLTVNDRDGFRNSTTLDITVKGEAPMEGFEVLNAPFHARIAQKILVHIPDSVIDDPTNQLQATLSGPERDRILFQKSGLSSEEEFLLDHRGLSRGEYVLQVKILDNNGHQLPGGLWKEKFSKEYEGIPRVGIDENNAVRVDGELHFPVQNWMMNFAYLPDYQTMKAINGVFYLTGGHISWYDSENEEWIYDLDILKSSYNEVLEPKGLMGITADRWSGKQTDNGALRNSDPSNIINYINELKDSPSVLAWCWDDEPNLDGWQSGGIPPQVLSAWHHMTSIEDPHHPTLTNLAGYMFCPGKIYKEEFSMMFSDRVLGKKAAVADIIHGALFALEAYKNYPDPEDPTRGAIDVYTDYLNNRREWNYDLLPTMAVSAPVRIILTDPAYYGPPTPDEVRMLNWLNVVHGVKGMNWYPYYGYTPAENFATMGEISQQLQELAPVILGPDKTDISVIDNANTKGNRIDTMIKETDDAYYLFTVRLTEREWWDDPSIEPEQISATFNITGLPDVVEATEYLEHKKIFENHGTESGGTDFNFTLEQNPVPGTISIGGVYKQSGSGESLNRKYYYIFDDSQGNIYLNGYWKEGGTLPAGTINYDTGEVSIYFPDMWGSDRKVEILPGIDCIVASYEPVREERRITIENGEFTDTFIRNGVHIYRIPKQFEENMHPPVLELIDKQTIEVGVNNCFDISAIDEDGGGLSYSAKFMPEGAEFNEDTREFTWNPSEEQVGTYLVEFTVTDLSGLTDSMEVILDVIKPVSAAPFIEEQPLSQAVKEGAEVTFSIVADGHPDPSYQWQYNGNDIEGATEAELTLTNVTTDNSGQYTVEVTNEHGSVSSDPANLIVVESPPSVENIKCIVEYHTTYLSWNNPEINDDIWNNVLIIRKKDSEPDNYKDGEEIYNGKGTSLTDRRLGDGTYYYAVYTYKNTDINNVYSDGIIIAVTIPDEFNKNYLSIDSDRKGRLLIGQNTRGDLYSLWNSPTSTIGRGPGGNETCLWVYSDIIGESIDQIPAGSDIIHAGLIFSVKDNSFNTEDIIQKARSINVYRITDPDSLGLPHYADESGIRVGLDFNYRDHRPGVNIPWQIHDGDSSQSTQVNSGDILSLIRRC
ncbi:MAG: PKD domain-containing protein [Halanaerobiales bacterium]